MKKNWVVKSNGAYGAYLKSLDRALDGHGLTGGAYTTEVKEARRFTAKGARNVAALIAHAEAVKL